MKRALALTVLGLSFTVGCTLEREYLDPNQANFGGGGEFGGEGNVNLQNATIRGDIGPIRQFDGEATGYGYDDPEFGSSQVTLNGQTAEGTGLVMLYLDTSIYDLPEGETHLAGSNDDFTGNYVQLCSDRTDGSVHFDGIAEDVKIVVTERGNVRNVDIDATISEGFDEASYANAEPTIVSTSFTVNR